MIKTLKVTYLPREVKAVPVTTELQIDTLRLERLLILKDDRYLDDIFHSREQILDALAATGAEALLVLPLGAELQLVELEEVKNDGRSVGFLQ